MVRRPTAGIEAWTVLVGGVVQGVGFRPFVYRLAHRHGLQGWVRNVEKGVEMHLEGPSAQFQAFLDELQVGPPAAARIVRCKAQVAAVQGFDVFAIRDSTHRHRPTVRIAPDLALCPDCWRELLDPKDRRHGYPYINCTNCGPRYSIVTALPYDRPHTTMRDWSMCPACTAEYHDPLDRRFHAQPAACPACGPQYALYQGDELGVRGPEAITQAAALLREGKIAAVKGLGGYHLACDARQEAVVQALRERKFRKEKPFALMVPDLDTAQRFVRLTPEGEALLTLTGRPIVLLPLCEDATEGLPEAVAPGNHELGLMLPYAPLHVLLFEQGAPSVLVMTSANRSNEPIAHRDDDAFVRLAGLADAFLVGERPIARRIEDSVVRVGLGGSMLLRRSRGYAPGAVTQLPTTRPILAVGADLKNTITLVVEGEAFVSQHIGDLDQYDVEQAFQQTIEDLTSMYGVPLAEALIVHDAHPQYRSTALALDLPGEKVAVQHHRAHIASVLAERQAWNHPVVGFAFDGTGYGSDGGIWGGEVFAGSLEAGLQRVAHLHPAVLPGGDAAAQHPVQAAAGFLAQLEDLPDLAAPPFAFPERYQAARELVQKGVRTFPTTSVGRLFDTVAALLGFTRAVTFEGQAAIWLEHLARRSPPITPYPFPELDFRPLLRAVIDDRVGGRPVAEIALAFHRSLAQGIGEMSRQLCATCDIDTLVLSGGVFQNQLLLHEVDGWLKQESGDTLSIWTNRMVPPNDGGVSLGQAALSVFAAAS